MKNLVLASILGSAATAFAVPALSGPVHFAITRPYSLFGFLPANTGQPVSVVLGTAPLDFVMTDVLFGGYQTEVYVTVNGSPVFNLGRNGGSYTENANLTTGIFIPAGSSIGVQTGAGGGPNTPVPVTLAGYVQ